MSGAPAPDRSRVERVVLACIDDRSPSHIRTFTGLLISSALGAIAWACAIVLALAVL